ncbi:hypothetical protein PIROE2DRAFT_10792, partial [Piromyces sp. E2]
MNLFSIVLLSLNILLIFGIFIESNDCINLRNFFNVYPEYEFSECCDSKHTICDDNGNITS